MRHAPTVFALTLVLTACSDGGEAERPQHQMVAAVRAGLNAVKAAPGGALVLFSDVRLIGRTTVCGSADGQDGGGRHRFASVAGAEALIEQAKDPSVAPRIEAACRGPSRRVTSRNPGYTDIAVDEQAR